MVIDGKVVIIKATGKGLIAEIELKKDERLTPFIQAFRVSCALSPKELDVGDDVVVTITKKDALGGVG